MGFYQFKRVQKIDKPIEEVWQFISDPRNLKVITPDYMGFDITSDDISPKMYPGMIISYIVSPLLGIKMNWVTEITHVKDNNYFVDEQRFGPYALWHHKHFIKSIDQGVEMEDIIDYKIPFGILGQLANPLIVKKQLKQIFAYREEKLTELFGKVEGVPNLLEFKSI